MYICANICFFLHLYFCFSDVSFFLCFLTFFPCLYINFLSIVYASCLYFPSVSLYYMIFLLYYYYMFIYFCFTSYVFTSYVLNVYYVDTDRKNSKVFQLRKKNSTNRSDFCLPLPSSFKNSSFCHKTGIDINCIAVM